MCFLNIQHQTNQFFNIKKLNNLFLMVNAVNPVVNGPVNLRLYVYNLDHMMSYTSYMWQCNPYT